MENLNKDLLNKQILNLIETDNDSRTKYYEWLKNLITIAVGFIAIIVSLKTKKSETNTEHYFYLLMLCSNLLGIFSGTIILFGEIKVLQLAVKKRKEIIINSLNKTLISNLPQIHNVKRPKFYFYLEYLCYFSFIISLISLVLYANVSDKI